MTQFVQVGSLVFDREKQEEPLCQRTLALARADQSRAFCQCTPRGVAMYIARRNGLYYLARLPGSALKHHPQCPSFDLEEEGVDPDGNRLPLDVSFPLFRRLTSLSLTETAKLPQADSADGAQRMGAPGPSLGLANLLLMLWRKAGLNRWRPGMTGKRNWWLARTLIRAEAGALSVHGHPLEELLMLPEVFRASRSEAHQFANHDRLKKMVAPGDKVNPLALVAGIVRSYLPSKYGCRLQIRHLPDVVFYLGSDLSRRLTMRHPFELLGLGRDSPDDLLAIMLVEQTAAGNLAAVDCALIRITPEWIPVFSPHERELINFLVGQQRGFIKPVSGHGTAAAAAAYLTDVGGEPYPLYIDHRNAKTAASWHWNPAQKPFAEAAPLPEPRNVK